MKELSIEEKAKAYDKAYKKVAIRFGSNVADEIFLKESEDERIRKRLLELFKEHWSEEWYGLKVKDVITWLEKQGNLMKCLQIANSKIGDLIEENYYLRENLEKQGNNMGISEATKQKLEDNLNKALEKETPESWNKFLDEQGEQKSTIEMITPEESLGIDSDTYNKIVDECVYGEQKPAEEYNITGIDSKHATGKLAEKIKELELLKQGEQKPIKEHDACEFCEDRYGCVNPCSMKLIEEQKPIGEYNITGIGSKHATGKLAEKIKEFDEKTKELKLLKQGEQKPFGQRDECLHCQFNYDGECKGFCAMKRSNRKPHKPTDKVEHKFKVGDEIRTGNDESLTITKIDEKGYWSENLFICDFDEECIWDLVEQKSTDKTESRQYELTEFEKAVKQVMEEAIECGDTHNLKADADMLLRLVQKSSWSEEDEEQLDRALYMMEQLDMTKSWDDVYNWLKSLKERYTWRPSYEQMLAINTAINVLGKGTLNGKYLIELQELLKKLREK